ncbi:M4 family metallopeptidase [Streptomyces lavendulae]|uniref:Transglutaminase-activating metalloprotease n=1 Tax=Streptomyces lavendulae subsp. lavendulae TaxID=58340 RepID=A0A2K8PCD1_STRLA|nr:M4 family metallopeptidase [Streptomyces lavendulae]ATZ24379.1 Transglutaminase-activating metalloprotease precursor [Streptomyces lavendulae subsp. lavendulae]QUQ54209.1 Transglutaminase-activating metalloprotease [Streptomyces lavendulae subsp. lavendulae]
MSSTPQRRATAAGALVAAAALLAVGIQAGTATADVTASQAAKVAQPNPGAANLVLSASERATLLADANSTTVQAAKALGLGSGEKLVVRDVVKDADGTTHTTYERTYNGLPVLGGDLTVHAKGGVTKSVTKATNHEIKVADTSATVTPSAAEGTAFAALSAAGGKDAKAEQGARKVIWAAEGAPVLAYETVVGGVQSDGVTPSKLHVVTDARTGAKITEWQAVEKGIGNTEYSGQVTLGTSQSGSNYTLTDAGRGGHKTYDLNGGSSGTGTLFTSTSDTWGNGSPSNRQTAGADAAYGAQLTWDYYKNVHGRNGLRNDGVAPYSRVHYGNAYVNAFWDDSCFCMTYGDGTGNNHPLTSIDVAAHEMTHGLTSVTGNMTYSGEPGGLNEATSDIMAANVEFAANNPNDVGDYLVGEKIDINGDGTPLRYMDKPSKDGGSKDAWYSGIGSIDVHYSSGPANHVYYLMSEGSGAKVINGVSYDSPTSDGLPVTAIGRDAAAKIWFRALTVGYFKSNTNYAAARTATLQAAADLYGQGSTTYNNVANAWAGINVGARIVSGVSVTPIANQTTQINTAVSLQVQATSTNPGALSYAATGLPAGLSINSSTGLISGTATTAGTSNVTVTVTDSANKTGTASFTWTVGTAQQNVFENTNDYAINDNATVESPITVTRTGNAPSTLKVDVDIKHTYVGDLRVDLVAPDGTVYNLRNRSGGSADNILQSFTVNASSEVAQGVWKLRVADLASADTGKIDSWKLTF